MKLSFHDVILLTILICDASWPWQCRDERESSTMRIRLTWIPYGPQLKALHTRQKVRNTWAWTIGR